mmetsp:Transcript_18473/g.57559  ORF Transcript_18473/g.57559 Transcript_18473/m.57559 type:complete len:256 (-) Transcript_18473:232-999(-)
MGGAWRGPTGRARGRGAHGSARAPAVTGRAVTRPSTASDAGRSYAPADETDGDLQSVAWDARRHARALPIRTPIRPFSGCLPPEVEHVLRASSVGWCSSAVSARRRTRSTSTTSPRAMLPPAAPPRLAPPGQPRAARRREGGAAPGRRRYARDPPCAATAGPPTSGGRSASGSTSQGRGRYRGGRRSGRGSRECPHRPAPGACPRGRRPRAAPSACARRTPLRASERRAVRARTSPFVRSAAQPRDALRGRARAG